MKADGNTVKRKGKRREEEEKEGIILFEDLVPPVFFFTFSGWGFFSLSFPFLLEGQTGTSAFSGLVDSSGQFLGSCLRYSWQTNRILTME